MADRYGIQLNGGIPPGNRGSSSPDGLQLLNMFFMIPGVILCLAALNKYPPLDRRMPWSFMLCLYLLPVAVHMLIWIFKPNLMAGGPWRKMYISACLVLISFSLFLFLNGGMDRSQLSRMSTTIIRKSAYRGRRGTSYNLVVTSWRPGRKLEHFGVGKAVYERAQVGRTATIDVHKGFFGLAWHGPISPE
jgi:hypothetical protein